MVVDHVQYRGTVLPFSKLSLIKSMLHVVFSCSGTVQRSASREQVLVVRFTLSAFVQVAS